MSGTDLRIVFMGTPDFAVASLKLLVENNYNIVGVITAPDKPAGRGRSLQQSAVKTYAVEQGLKVLQPDRLKDETFISELKALKADLQIVVAFRMLPEVVWNMPPMGTFNLHGSLLPKYRGAAPLNWAVINGDNETGVTTFKLKHEIDTGNIMFQEKIEIGPDDNVGTIHDKLMDIGAALVVKTVDAIANETVEFIDQEQLINDGQDSTHAPKIFKDDCLIDWNNDGQLIKNLVRGLSPYPAAWTNLYENGKAVKTAKIFEVDFIESTQTSIPGTIESDGKTFIKVACKNGYLNIKVLQLSGKKRMNTDEFLRGFNAISNYNFQA